MNSKQKENRKDVMDDEIQSLMKNQTWVIVPKPQAKKTIRYQWIFKLKECVPWAEAKRFKARLVAKGFTQKEGED